MTGRINAIILAAGESQRMGQPKQLLPWGASTVLGQITSTCAAGLSSLPDLEYEILVVTGAWREQLEAEVSRLAGSFPVRAVFNPDHKHAGMLRSIQVGLADLRPEESAALVVLGDQPQMEAETIRAICKVYYNESASLVIPSFEKRRGHPWLVAHSLWQDILALPGNTTPRQFLNIYAQQIVYVDGGPSILQDLDTPRDYLLQKP